MNTGLSTFDRTVQTTTEWLNEIMDELPTSDRRKAYLALRSTLHALRDRLTVEEATDLAAQLPTLVRSVYYEGWNPSGKPEKARTIDEYLALVEDEIPRGVELDTRRAVEVVFGVLSRRVSEGEARDVKGMLPEPVRALWPSPATPE